VRESKIFYLLIGGGQEHHEIFLFLFEKMVRLSGDEALLKRGFLIARKVKKKRPTMVRLFFSVMLLSLQQVVCSYPVTLDTVADTVSGGVARAPADDATLSRDDVTLDTVSCTEYRYWQDEAPVSFSGVQRALAASLNSNRSGDRISIAIKWNGDYKDRKPGNYLFNGTIDGVPHCFKYTILNVNECGSGGPDLKALRHKGHPWHHQCHHSAECVDTEGSYECRCPAYDVAALSPLSRSVLSSSALEGRRLDRSGSLAVAYDKVCSSSLIAAAAAESSNDSGKLVCRAVSLNSKWQGGGKLNTSEACSSDTGSHSGSARSKGSNNNADGSSHTDCKREFRCHESLCQHGSNSGMIGNRKSKGEEQQMHNCESEVAVCVDRYDDIHGQGFECRCPETFLGNGSRCLQGKSYKVFEDPNWVANGKDRQYTFIDPDGHIELDEGRVCGCNAPKKTGACVAARDCCKGKKGFCNEECSDGNHFPCVCHSDYITGSDGRCHDPTPPKIMLKSAKDSAFRPYVSPEDKNHRISLKQCVEPPDWITDFTIADDNKEPSEFTMEGNLPSSCLADFHTGGRLPTYTLTFKTWTGPADDPWSLHEVNRTIEIEDADECAQTGNEVNRNITDSCPSCRPRCSSDATCVNTKGSYRCECPRCGQQGDGFDTALGKGAGKHTLPFHFVNGTGCQDSCPPRIELLGDPEPSGEHVTVFEVPKCDGPLCAPAPLPFLWVDRLADMLAANRDLLCPLDPRADPPHSKRMPFPCAVAVDPALDGAGLGRDGYPSNGGRQLPADTIRVGINRASLVKSSQENLEWKISYDVVDEAGNAAETVYRTIVVKEKTLEDARAEQQEIAKGIMPRTGTDAAHKAALLSSSAEGKGGKKVSSCKPGTEPDVSTGCCLSCSRVADEGTGACARGGGSNITDSSPVCTPQPAPPCRCDKGVSSDDSVSSSSTASTVRPVSASPKGVKSSPSLSKKRPDSAPSGDSRRSANDGRSKDANGDAFVVSSVGNTQILVQYTGSVFLAILLLVCGCAFIFGGASDRGVGGHGSGGGSALGGGRSNLSIREHTSSNEDKRERQTVTSPNSHFTSPRLRQSPGGDAVRTTSNPRSAGGFSYNLSPSSSLNYGNLGGASPVVGAAATATPFSAGSGGNTSAGSGRRGRSRSRRGGTEW
jgi:hypothetical protein